MSRAAFSQMGLSDALHALYGLLLLLHRALCEYSKVCYAACCMPVLELA
jgi:hypothetical protein